MTGKHLLYCYLIWLNYQLKKQSSNTRIQLQQPNTYTQTHLSRIRESAIRNKAFHSHHFITLFFIVIFIVIYKVHFTSSFTFFLLFLFFFLIINYILYCNYFYLKSKQWSLLTMIIYARFIFILIYFSLHRFKFYLFIIRSCSSSSLLCTIVTDSDLL